MGLQDDLLLKGIEIAKTPWKTTEGTKVPDVDDVALGKNSGVYLDATYLYADLADSTTLAQKCTPEQTGTAIRMFLSLATACIKDQGGVIRSFDGDRVMGIFVGDNKSTSAVRAALYIDWCVSIEMNMLLDKYEPDVIKVWTPRHCSGIATGRALMAKGGVFKDNDLISIGDAPNIAAKLSEIRDFPHTTYITDDVYIAMNMSVTNTKTGVDMWKFCPSITMGGRAVWPYKTSYYRTPPD